MLKNLSLRFYIFLKYIFDNFVLLKNNRTKIGKVLLNNSETIKEKFDDDIKKQSQKFYDENKKKYDEIVELHPVFKLNKIPNNGLKYDECIKIIEILSERVLKNVKNNNFSGMIYGNYLDKGIEKIVYPENSNEIDNIHTEIFRHSKMWNSLHSSEFCISNFINYYLGVCVSELFGGTRENTQALITNGGTQSIMTSARIYINKYNRERLTIIAPDTIHPSLNKAAQSYNFNLILIKTNNGEVDKDELIKQVEKNKNNLAALYCSYPSYPYGNKDDIKFFAKLADYNHCGLHIDCCLGGFIINFVDETVEKLLNFAGVSSVSFDTHKNGLAPKGSSILILKNNLVKNSIYVFNQWNGGLYGTPNDAGSISNVESFCALMTLLYHGKNYYKNTAKNIENGVKKIIEKIDENLIEIINKNAVNVLAFRMKKGSTYKLADLMKEKGYHFNCMGNNIIHFCFTKRFENNYDDFIENINKLAATQNVIESISEEERLYCSIEKINNPNKNNDNFIENYFFGELGLKEVIKSYFLAIINPYYSQK